MNAGPGSIGRTLEMAIQSKNDKEETSAGAFGYGAATNDPERKNVQDSLKRWAMQWSSGPFSLGGPPPPPGEGMPPEEGA